MPGVLIKRMPGEETDTQKGRMLCEDWSDADAART